MSHVARAGAGVYEMSVDPAIPDLVRRYAERAIPPDRPIPRRVRIEQHGDMWRARESKPLRFTAIEEFAVAEVGFSWRARFRVLPLIAMRIHDGFARQEAWMRGTVLGVPFMSKRGGDLTIGAAMRYLAELPWVPHALTANQQIAWRAIDGHTVEASVATDPRRAAVSLGFDTAGDIIRTYAHARPRDGDSPRAWGGVFGDYAVVGGVRIPTSAEVRWELPDGPFTYWRGTVTALELVDSEEGSR